LRNSFFPHLFVKLFSTTFFFHRRPPPRLLSHLCLNFFFSCYVLESTLPRSPLSHRDSCPCPLFFSCLRVSLFCFTCAGLNPIQQIPLLKVRHIRCHSFWSLNSPPVPPPLYFYIYPPDTTTHPVAVFIAPCFDLFLMSFSLQICPFLLPLHFEGRF